MMFEMHTLTLKVISFVSYHKNFRTKVGCGFSLCFILTFTTQPVCAQSDLDDALKGTVKDARYLATGYITPFLKTIGTGVNAGWNNTAKPHKPLGLDLTITVSPVFIPSSDKTYEVDNSKLEAIQLQSTPAGTIQNGKANVPTVFGSENNPVYVFKSDGRTIQGPPGIDLKKNIGINALPVPMIHLGVGIYKNTDLKLRFFPEQKFGDFKVRLFGIGVLHDVKQWIPGIKHLPFDLSGFFGYTRLKIATQLGQSGQVGAFDVTGITIQGLISKKLSVLTLYGGVGYNMARSKVALEGTYDLDEDATTGTSGREAKDPLAVSAMATGPRLTAGMRLKLAAFTFHGDYTIQKYNALS